jgi:hypothetical protein
VHLSTQPPDYLVRWKRPPLNLPILHWTLQGVDSVMGDAVPLITGFCIRIGVLVIVGPLLPDCFMAGASIDAAIGSKVHKHAPTICTWNLTFISPVTGAAMACVGNSPPKQPMRTLRRYTVVVVVVVVVLMMMPRIGLVAQNSRQALPVRGVLQRGPQVATHLGIGHALGIDRAASSPRQRRQRQRRRCSIRGGDARWWIHHGGIFADQSLLLLLLLLLGRGRFLVLTNHVPRTDTLQQRCGMVHYDSSRFGLVIGQIVILDCTFCAAAAAGMLVLLLLHHGRDNRRGQVGHVNAIGNTTIISRLVRCGRCGRCVT